MVVIESVDAVKDMGPGNIMRTKGGREWRFSSFGQAEVVEPLEGSDQEPGQDLLAPQEELCHDMVNLPT